MRETNPDSSEEICVDVTLAVYLRHRMDPVNINVTFQLKKDHLLFDDDGEDLIDPVETFMDIVLNTFVNAWNDRTASRFTLSDRYWNKFLIQLDEVQAISLMTPAEQIREVLEENGI